jgi:hypothetical protein
MSNTQFTYPISDTRQWEGQLHISAQVDDYNTQINSVLLEDRVGRKTDITGRVEEFGFDLEDLEYMARNDYENVGRVDESEDYTMSRQ